MTEAEAVQTPEPRPTTAADDRLTDALLGWAQAGLQLTGAGGLPAYRGGWAPFMRRGTRRGLSSRSSGGRKGSGKDW